MCKRTNSLKNNPHTIVVIVSQEKEFNVNELSVDLIVHQNILNA